MKAIRFLFVDDNEKRCKRAGEFVRLLNEELKNTIDHAPAIVLDIANASEEAIGLLSMPVPPYDSAPGPRYDVVSLDHDMADEHYKDIRAGKKGERTGRDITLFIVENPSFCPPFCNVHSWNTWGVKAMIADLNGMETPTPWKWLGMHRFPKLEWLSSIVSLLEGH